VVTGASGDIGQAISVIFAEAGAVLSVVGRTDSRLKQIATEVKARGTECLPVSCDVRDELQVMGMRDSVLEAFGVPDIVVANVGDAGPRKLMHLYTLGEWRECIASNLDACFLTFRAFIPGMMTRRSGSLIAIASMTGKRSSPNRSAYATAKMGIVALVRALAAELGPYGIRVNAISPGWVDGSRVREAIARDARSEGVTEEEVRTRMMHASPLGRLLRPEDVARACLFVASELSSGITGEDVNVSAGVVMY
jgi:NAD(P)-dependent dehydrogenase (short-subunit alcohol dehydrogenase family)